MGLDSVIHEIIKFRDDRDWAQFHRVRNLVAELNVEVAGLQELVLCIKRKLKINAKNYPPELARGSARGNARKYIELSN